MIGAIARAQDEGRVARNAYAAELGVFFLTGLFGLLAGDKSAPKARAAHLTRYVKAIVLGMETTMNDNGIDGYRVYLDRRDGEADLLNRRLAGREEFFGSLESNETFLAAHP